MHRLLLVWVISACATAQLSPGVWKTDMSRKSINLSELHRSLAKDAIPSIDHPRFISVAGAGAWLGENEPVLIYASGGVARAYPVQILLFHELVNDIVNGLPLLVSFCPLCNSGMTFDRRVDGRTLSFGVAGLLRHSDMVMYDRQTDSLWQQITGEAIVGAYTGRRLEVITSQMVPFGAYAKSFPSGQVMDRPSDSAAPYGSSLYVNYEWGKRETMPAGLPGTPPVAPLERVVTIEHGGRRRAYTFDILRRSRVYEDKVDDLRYVIFFEPEMQSAMDGRQIADSRPVGTAGVFSPTLDGRRLRFRRRKRQIVDKETGSVWNVLGRAIEGPLTGRRLEPIPHGVFFAFAVTAFHPETYFVGQPLRSF
jgi:uncharacterized protein DUF3179